MHGVTSSASPVVVLGVTAGANAPEISIEALITNPGLAATLPPAVARALLARLVVLQNALLPALLAPAEAPGPAGSASDDAAGEWLNTAQVAARFSLDARWLQDHAKELRRLKIVSAPSRKVRLYHARRLARYLEARCG